MANATNNPGNPSLVADTTTLAPAGYFYDQTGLHRQDMVVDDNNNNNNNNIDDNDSALGDDRDSSTASLSESIFNYQYENGRRYHAFRAGAYPLPNDELEQDRMDMQHHIYLLIFGGELHRAPLPKTLRRALDIGCGTGLWAIDFADSHPETQVIATDLSYIQPTWVPSNLQFEIDDAEEEWTFGGSNGGSASASRSANSDTTNDANINGAGAGDGDGGSNHDNSKFDYIHIRSMAGSIGDWPRLLERAYNHLTPGGWIELTEFETWASTDDGSLPVTSAYHEYQVRLCEAAASFGKEMNIAPQIYGLVCNAGFVQVRAEVQKCPLSPWPKDRRLKELAMYMNLQMMESIEPYGLALFSRVLKWDTPKIYALLDGVRKDLRNLNYHMYSRVHCVYGQKPYS